MFSRPFLGVAGLALTFLAVPSAFSTELTFEQRVDAQRAIERVYWSHRLWPATKPEPRPAFSRAIPEAALRAKVNDYLSKSNARAAAGRPITAPQLQGEIDRMAAGTRAPAVLREIFDALGNDPYLVGETLARQTLVGRTMGDVTARDAGRSAEAGGRYVLPTLAVGGCVPDTWAPTLGAAPGPRWESSAVWTGAEMIVWGGSNGFASLRDGGRYDPATDSWSPTSTGANVPAARRQHSAVWTGTEMIVWGGADASSKVFGTGGRYDPSTDSWAALSTGAYAPAARVAHTAVWSGSEMLVWGGYGSGFLRDGGRYDPSTDSWRPISTLGGAPQARDGHSAVWTGSEMIVWGGYGFGFLRDGGRYDPSTDTWAPTSTGPNVPSGRVWHPAVWTGNEMIVWGGWNGAEVGTGARYDPGNDLWTPMSIGANAPSGRFGHAMVWTGSEAIVWGGGGNGYLGDGGRYAPGTDTWTPVPTTGAPSARGHVTGVWTGSEMIVWGGESGATPLDTGGRFSPASNSWTAVSRGVNLPEGRAGHTAVWTGSELVVWGGHHDGVTNAGSRYVPATDAWTPTSIGAGVPSARQLHVAVWTGHRMIVWGGIGDGDQPLQTGGTYDPSSDTWNATSTEGDVPSARSSATAVWTGSQLLVWGGYDATAAAAVASGARYDPATNAWTSIPVVDSTPEARAGHSAVWDGKEMIVWGGAGLAPLNTGGRYDPVKGIWTATSIGANVPDPRDHHGAVWTGREMVVWGGFGGRSSGGRYDPLTDTWTPTSTGENVPEARSRHSAVWTGTEMIVWGGMGDSDYFDTGGRYDPLTDSWSATSTEANLPSARWSHEAVWTGTEMLLSGGIPTSSSLGRYCAADCEVPATFHQDLDGDDYGEASVALQACVQPPGYASNALDCNDRNGGAHPGGVEVCNRVDDDCDGMVDNLPGPDADGDAVPDSCDNCPASTNPTQADFDEDGLGDVCETDAALADADRSGRVDGIDLARLGRAFGSLVGDFRYDASVDLDRDGAVDGDDLAALVAWWGLAVAGS